MSIEKGTLHHYRLKAEFKKLFENLASGETFTQKEAFMDQSKPHAKSYQSEDEARYHKETLKKLVDAGFVGVEGEEIEYLAKG